MKKRNNKRNKNKKSNIENVDSFVLGYMEEVHFSSCTIDKKETIQRLWGGYGEIVRYNVNGQYRHEQPMQRINSIILKNVRPPALQNGRDNEDISHLRKLRSYQVETHFYEVYALKILENEDLFQKNKINDPYDLFHPRIPRLLANMSTSDIDENPSTNTLILLEDLDVAGYPERLGYGSDGDLEERVMPIVQWLARFHGTFLLNKKNFIAENNSGLCNDKKRSINVPDKNEKSYPVSYFPGLWEQGCYWHLDTRPDEYDYMKSGHVLKKAAKMLDKRLKHHSNFITLLHGDAKACNFCFSKPMNTSSSVGRNGNEKKCHVAAVDFQYCGGGVGLRDLAYLLQSCMSDDNLNKCTDSILDYYFEELFQVANINGILSQHENQILEKEWRELWSSCFADFERFLTGWSYGHESYGYGKMMIDQALELNLPSDL